MKLDYIIVGGGYAGLMFAHQLIKHKKSFVIITDGKKSASEISAGVCNPVVLKRFTSVWNAQNEIDAVLDNFKEIKSYLGENFVINEHLVRIFHDKTEQELWLKKSNKDDLKEFLNTDLIKLKSVKNEFLSAKVNHSLRINVTSFFNAFYEYFEEHHLILKESFAFEDLDMQNKTYKDLEFENIVFCEGVHVNKNPFFSDIPVKGNRGHSMVISSDTDIDPYIIKKKFFLFNTFKNHFFVGGTYERDETSSEINQDSVNKLKAGLEEIFDKSYNIEEVNVAFRAVVPDRRPIVGSHHKHQNMFILNGMGARGVMNSNYFAKQLFEHIEHGTPIFPEVDIKRFK